MSDILTAIRTFNDRHPNGTGAHVREVGRDNGAMLRAAMMDNTSPAPAGQPASQPVARTTTRRPVATGTQCPDGKMALPAKLTYAMVDAMAAKLAPCKYALRKTDGTVTFFEVSEYRGTHRIQMLAGAPGRYQRYPMKLAMQFVAITHLLDDPMAAIKLFADKAGHCARCHSPLTDPVSLAAGLGPDCIKRV